ncbi:hypothetical protein BGZ51_005612 [Haplosporangium sp. Z 767]|nr:hypothetical protein BGZ51_005612 [Haplosporangium sp. Z 767]
MLHSPPSSSGSSSSRPVSILKSKPKSILRSRSVSHSSPQSERPMSQDYFIPAFPAPPTSARSSTHSDTSSVSRSNLYLQQDPMADIQRNSTQSQPETATKSRRSSIQSQGRRTDSDPDHLEPVTSSPPLSDLISTNTHSRPRMPPTSSSTHPLTGVSADHEEQDPIIKMRPFGEHPNAPISSSHHRLSFPSLNDYKPIGTSLQPMGPNIPQATTPPQNYTPLTLKSVRLAKSRSKLRQEPQVGVATGMRRSSLPKAAFSTSSSSSPCVNEGLPELSGATLAPPIPAPLSKCDSRGSITGVSAGNKSIEGSLLSQQQLSRGRSPSRRRESSSTSGNVQNVSPVMPRPILKDTSARDRMQRESWMPEQPAPPKSLARANSSKRQSRLNRISALEYDQDALTPRTRNVSAGYGPDYKPRRQSGGPGHLLFSVDPLSSGAELESEDYDESDAEDSQHRAKHLQEQYALLQKSQMRQSGLETRTSAGSTSATDQMKKVQRKSLGDELNVPPIPEKSMQRKRVSTMGSATLPAVSPTLSPALNTGNSSTATVSETSISLARSNSQKQKDRRPFGSIGPNSLSFEPLFAIKEPTSKSIQGEGLQQSGNKDNASSRLSAVSDADLYTAMLTVDLNQHGVSILDLSKRGLEEIPSDLPGSITHLRLAYNTIKVLSPITSLTTLNHLQVLDLCDNQLELLPPEIGLLTRLKELYLSNNNLWKLPDTIQKMVRLEVLDIRNNHFYLLNPAVGRLKALRQLDVRNNQLKSLPAPLCMLSLTLTVLLVDGNQFVPPFSNLLQPLLIEDSESTASGRQNFLGDDPYADPTGKGTGSSLAMPVGIYEPWRRSVTVTPRRAGVSPASLPKRRSHGDLMSLMGLQRKDGNSSTDDLLALTSDPAIRANTISTSSGAHIVSSLSIESSGARRERSVSTSTMTPATEMHNTESSASNSNSLATSHPLSFNKFLKSIRKNNKTTLKEGQLSKGETATKRFSLGSEVDALGDMELELQESEPKPASKGASSTVGGLQRRTTAGGINQWVRDRFHKRTNSNEFGTLPGGHGSGTSVGTDGLGASEVHTVRDSGYGVISGSAGSQSSPTLNSSPEMVPTGSQGKTSSLLGSRYQNKSTGHLPFGSSISQRDSQRLSSSFDPSYRKERDYRYSYMSIESQLTQGTEQDSELVDLESALALQSQQQQQQQHRLSSMHSPTTPLPSSPVIGGVVTNGHAPHSWNASTPRYGQSAAFIKPFMHYLRDLYDLDPDSSEWEEVYAWRRVWNAERSIPLGLGVTSDSAIVEDAENQEQKQAKDEEIRIAKLQAQASRRRRIVAEIMSTERTYVEGLKGLVEIYLTPALQVMPPGDHKAVFSNAQAIYTFHAEHFLPELEKAYQVAPETNPDQKHATVVQPMSPVPMSNSFPSEVDQERISNVPSSATGESLADRDSSSDSKDQGTPSSSVAANEAAPIKIAVEDRIGRVFAEHVAYMKMYSFYINNFDNALRVLQSQLTQAKYKKKMKEFLRRCAKHPNHTQLALQGYLLLPVQRIPRYKMLLQDLLENTWTDHVDYHDIATALEQISSRADEMNERKRQYENHEKVLLVQNRIIGQYKTPLVQPHRKVVREGMLHLIRVITRNVSMSLEKGTPPTTSPGAHVGDLTVHCLSEETVEKSFLFVLFNDIMIQCNPVAGKGPSLSSSGSSASGTILNGSSPAMTSMTANGAGSGTTSADTSNKSLELCRVLQLESRLHPAEIIGNDVLRVVDDAMILYLTGDKDVIQAWKEDINSRW